VTYKRESNRPEYDMGEIFRAHRAAYNSSHSMSPEQRKVLHDICVCRTSELGGHMHECSDECGYEIPVYNSCRNRHCPKCQGKAMHEWVKKRLEDLLPVPYFHNVFTLSHAFNVLVPYNESLMYDLMFASVSTAIKAQALKELGGKVGVVAVLHTWGQKLFRHVHIHCLITGGALLSDRSRWNPASKTYLMDVYELSDKFKDAFLTGIQKAYENHEIDFSHSEARPLKTPEAFSKMLSKEECKAWSLYSKPPFAGPAKVVEYMGRYTHRIGISNRRILSVTKTDLTFDYKDNKDLDANGAPRHKPQTLPIHSFMALFLQHTLPKSYRKIRYYGLLGGSAKTKSIELCRRLIHTQGIAEPIALPEVDPIMEDHLCPVCGKALRIKQKLHPARARSPFVSLPIGDHKDVA
jgi:hypothetical protein